LRTEPAYGGTSWDAFGMPLDKGPRIDTSQYCIENDHANCGHSFASRGRFIGKQPEANAVLCQCACHSICPIAGDECVPNEVWLSLCTCPGAVDRKEWQAESDSMEAERKMHVKEILASIELEETKSRSDYRSELERAFEEHGITASSYEFDMHAGILEAASGPSHLAGARVFGTFGRLISRAVRDIRKSSED
jgi:hypothetical protein